MTSMKNDLCKYYEFKCIRRSSGMKKAFKNRSSKAFKLTNCEIALKIA